MNSLFVFFMTSTEQLQLILPDESASLNFAHKLAITLKKQIFGLNVVLLENIPNIKIYLSGDLGAGKTTITREFLKAFGVNTRIKSPTYTLLETYKVSRLYLYHFDFYRFSDPLDWVDAGFKETLNSPGISLVEWPEMAQDTLPVPDLHIFLSYDGEGRIAKIKAFTNEGIECIKRMKAE
ncbi:tRNA (adenosine(37)-N6)-threonylcarbamoyltransferase complex ATPase subunit type 1 TsaE [Taylorella equigenitalis]|nr:tRNA (adenosine(37)-N6)-threonylcarbamoyltransferase complex ATPase subunit type 1 TsaE [Taylorella equigenitalis]